MRYAFHGHESDLDLRDVVAFEPELATNLARRLQEPSVEDAVAVLLDYRGASYVREQSGLLETVGKKWAELAAVVKTENDKERVRAIPERLCFRFDTVWREGRAAVHLMLRAVSISVGCDVRDAALHVDTRCVDKLMELLVDGLRKGFAASVDAPLAVSLLERAERASEVNPERMQDWAAEITA